MDYNSRWISIVEVPEFRRRAAALLGSEELTVLIDYLAANPGSGDLIQGTGGVRKLRWAYGARGKSAGSLFGGKSSLSDMVSIVKFTWKQAFRK